MKQLCAGIIDAGNAVWSIPTHQACIDASSVGHLAAALLTRHLDTMNAASSSSSSASLSAASLRHVVFPQATDLRAALLAPASCCLPSSAPPLRQPAQQDGESAPKRKSGEEGDFSELSHGTAAAAPQPASASAEPAQQQQQQIQTSFASETAQALLRESAVYARGEDKLCATAAFVFVLVPAAQQQQQQQASVALWAFCHVSPDTIQHAGQRVFELTCVSHVLARWAELCLADAQFKQLCSAPAVAGAGGAATRFAAAGEGAVLAWAAAALEDAQGDFGDARHATLDFLGE